MNPKFNPSYQSHVLDAPKLECAGGGGDHVIEDVMILFRNCPRHLILAEGSLMRQSVIIGWRRKAHTSTTDYVFLGTIRGQETSLIDSRNKCRLMREHPDTMFASNGGRVMKKWT